jgi:hypothetical protein
MIHVCDDRGQCQKGIQSGTAKDGSVPRWFGCIFHEKHETREGQFLEWLEERMEEADQEETFLSLWSEACVFSEVIGKFKELFDA